MTSTVGKIDERDRVMMPATDVVKTPMQRACSVARPFRSEGQAPGLGFKATPANKLFSTWGGWRVQRLRGHPAKAARDHAPRCPQRPAKGPLSVDLMDSWTAWDASPICWFGVSRFGFEFRAGTTRLSS